MQNILYRTSFLRNQDRCHLAVGHTLPLALLQGLLGGGLMGLLLASDVKDLGVGAAE